MLTNKKLAVINNKFGTLSPLITVFRASDVQGFELFVYSNSVIARDALKAYLDIVIVQVDSYEDLKILQGFKAIPLGIRPYLLVSSSKSELTLGRWVYESVFRQIKTWGETSLVFAVNISYIQLEDRNFASTFSHAARLIGINPKNVEIEITETSSSKNISAVALNVQNLRRQGFRVALDDFGVGFSTFLYIRDLEFDTLKIDSIFTQSIATSERDRKILQSLVTVGKTLGVETVAEGIETEAQRQILIKMGCEIGQGFLFDHALSVEDFQDRYMLTAV